MHHLLLLAKCPTAGSSKTRLIPRLGKEGAAQFAHAALVDHLHLLANETALRKTWMYTPSSAQQDALGLLSAEQVATKWEAHPQSEEGKDLGHRLSAAFTFAKSCIPPDEMDTSSVTFMGMDCFGLSAERIRQVASAAASGVAQVLPADDGGYVLLSVPARCPDSIFDDIPWSCDRTCQAQIASIERHGVTVCVGETLEDVDEPADLEGLMLNEEKLHSFPRTWKVLKQFN